MKMTGTGKEVPKGGRLPDELDPDPGVGKADQVRGVEAPHVVDVEQGVEVEVLADVEKLLDEVKVVRHKEEVGEVLQKDVDRDLLDDDRDLQDDDRDLRREQDHGA